jgi:adenosine deaminase
MQRIRVSEDENEIKKLLTVGEGCTDLNDYLKCFEFPLSLLQRADAIDEAVYTVLTDLSEKGVIYAEIRFAPQLHTRSGLTQEDAVKAAVRGAERAKTDCSLILCCMRGEDNREANLETVRLGKKYRELGVGGIDLAGAEGLYPTEMFAYVFELARELGVSFTIHAGEADGCHSVRTALDFGAKRIGHGVRSVEDKELLKRLAESGTVLELCPKSNLDTHIFNSLSEYPLPQLMQAGVKVTINSDNMAVSGVNVRDELEAVAKEFKLSMRDIKSLLINSINASFAEDSVKNRLHNCVELDFMLHI